jgi:hypothetical protein
MASSQIAAIPGKITDAAQDAVELQKQKVQTLAGLTIKNGEKMVV